MALICISYMCIYNLSILNMLIIIYLFCGLVNANLLI